jgi:hypothetical protein
MTLVPLIIVCLTMGDVMLPKRAWAWCIASFLVGFIMAAGTADRPHLRPYWEHMLK